jgi:hypothetical protein
MIFRRREERIGHEIRLRALGHLLDERGYELSGLCILTVGEGFEVTGLRVPQRGAAYDLEQHTESIAAEELTAVVAQLRNGK